MQLLNFIRRESTVSLSTLAIMAGLSGFSNAGLLAVVNEAATHAAQDRYSLQHLALYAVLLGLYRLTQNYVMNTTSSEAEEIIHRVRLRLSDKVRHGDLQALEHLGRSDIHAVINRDVLTISQAAPLLALAPQWGMLILFIVLYIAWLSPLTCLFCLAFSALALAAYCRRQRALNQALHQATLGENRFFDALTDILDGFKELKLNEARGRDLAAHAQAISAAVRSLKVQVQKQLTTNFVFYQAILYGLLGTVVFAVPHLSPAYSEVVVRITAAVLFLIGPITGLVAGVPLLIATNAACENIAALEETLDRCRDPAVTTTPPLTAFREIRLQGVFFYYTDAENQATFRVGPIDLTLTAGEMLFIAGGNGSGKSTLMKLLSGLYRPMGGVISVDGEALDDTRRDAYRQLFSVIFADYHLFKRLYGVRGVDPAGVNALLEEMDIAHKTRLVDGEFQTLDLSTGQKKRLALVVTLLENRPVYVFDEWAADQDPRFRRRFYEELLPRFKAGGKTVVAVTHDDRYYGVADRVAKMEEGRLVGIEEAG